MNLLYLPISFFGLLHLFSSVLQITPLQNPQFSTQTITIKDTLPACAQKDVHQKWLNENPAFQQRENQQEAARKIRSQNRGSIARRGVPYEIPVVVHVIHNNGPENISDTQIEKGIQFLNEGFSNSGGFAGTGGADVEV